MTRNQFSHFILGAILIGTISCNEIQSARTGEIVLGDSALIVTETDPQYLQNVVDDIGNFSDKSAAPAPTSVKDTAASLVTASQDSSSNKVADTVIAKKEEPKAAESKNTTASAKDGFSLQWDNVKITWKGMEAKDLQKQSLAKDYLTYLLTQGKISEAKVDIAGLKNVSIKQRYQTSLVAKARNLGTLELDNLGLYTSSWTTVKAPDYNVLPADNKLTYTGLSKAQLKRGVEKRLQQLKSKSTIKTAWLKAIQNANNVNQAPYDILLNNVQWQIQGKMPNGKNFSKIIRFDMR